ncbi:MAG TPA: hypothetical protein PKA02_03740 [Candidatus Saccharibacteria bacterium]|nr:hypothetical protein [Candidatus Saccharibacteria bacterium]
MAEIEGVGGLHPKINGAFGEAHLLSMHQFSPADIDTFLQEALAAEAVMRTPGVWGRNLLPGAELKAVMRQPSTRTGGSMATAMTKLGGGAQVISGMAASSEGKGETVSDSWVAFATQADIIGCRTAEAGGVEVGAMAIDDAVENGKLWKRVPVINLGDGVNEHPTQTLGDVFTIYKKFGYFADLTIATVGDHERYRSHHSLMIGASILGVKIIAVESSAAPVPEPYVELLGDNLERTRDLDGAIQAADVLCMGRNPDEYSGEDDEEQGRSAQLAVDYQGWIVDRDRLQQMKPSGMVLHARPRRNELDPSIDADPRAHDVEQMANMIPARMAAIALLMGVSIKGSRQ